MSNNAHELSNRLLNALDNNYNVVDMHTVNEIISILEKINITKELLETTRLGKHVNELRRKTTDPTLARRAKVLVKRWRDLVIPSPAPAHTGSNRSSAERQVRRLGGTPLTSPALSLSRQVLSPAMPGSRPPSRPAWGGYESDSQDVILVDDDGSPPPPLPPPVAPPPVAPPPPVPVPGPKGGTPAPSLVVPQRTVTPPVKRPPSPQPVHDEKKSKRDKKPKKRKGHSRAGSGTETTSPPSAPVTAPGAGAPSPCPGGGAWGARNGAPERRRNGCKRDAIDPYAALVNKMPAIGAKKVKTTQELLEQIQSRGPRPASPDDDVVVIDDIDIDVTRPKFESPLRNGAADVDDVTPAIKGEPLPAPRTPSPLPPLEDEREYIPCTCGEEEIDENCLAAVEHKVFPYHIRALHNAYLPGINGTRAPTHPHQFAVRKIMDPEKPGLFTSVVPLYKYSDYADDYCVKNMSEVPLCTHLPWTEFAPPPPDLPPPKSPPPLRPYPIDTIEVKKEVSEDIDEDSNSQTSQDSDKREIKIELKSEKSQYNCKIEPEMMSLPNLEPSERLKAPILTSEDETNFGRIERPQPMEIEEDFKSEQRDHRTVERTKTEIDGRTLYALCEKALESVPYSYSQVSSAPVVTLPQDTSEGPSVLESALEAVAADRDVDELGRPPRPTNFTEWHECAKLGDLIALPYVVID